MRSLKKLFCCGILAVAATLPGKTLEFSPEQLNIATPKKQSEEWKSVSEKDFLRIENIASKGFCEFFVRNKIVLPPFEVIGIDVKLDRTATSPLQNFSIRLQDATGEIFQYTLAGMTLPEGDDIRFTIDRKVKPFASWGGNQDGKIDLPAKLHGGTFRFRGEGGTLILKGIAATVREKAAAAPQLSLKLPAHRLPLFDPAQKEAALEVRNPNPFALETQIAVTIRNMATDKMCNGEKRTVKLAGNGTGEFSFPLPPEYGVYELTYTAGTATGTLRFGCMVPAGKEERSAPGFLFGICSQHLPRMKPELAEREIAAIALCGADIVRYCSYWDVMEPKRGEFRFGPLDFVVSSLEKYGLKSQVLHSRSPNWAIAAGWKPVSGRSRPGRPLPDFEAWRNSVKAFTERYKGRIAYTEIWNEPDLFGFADFSTDDYLTLLSIAAKEIRANDPETVILSGGFASIPPPNWTSGNPDIVKRTMTEGREDYDIFALHNHSTFPYCVNVIDRMFREKELAGEKKPWYMNESGLSNRSYSEPEQAAAMFRKILYCRARGAMAFNWYALRNDGWDKSNNEHNFGIMLHDFQPKLSYVAFNMLTTIYSGSEFRKIVTENDGWMSLLFENEEGYLFANYRNRDDSKSTYAALSGVTGKVSRIDLYGNAVPVPVKDGVAVIRVDEPHTLKVTGELPVWNDNLVRFSGIHLERGRANLVQLELFNPSGREQVVRFAFDGMPDTLKVAVPADGVKVSPGVSAKVELTVTPAAEHDASASGEMRLTMGALGEITLALPFEYVTGIAHGGFAETPDFVLNRREQVSIQAPSAPEYRKLIWNGPEDCSARLFLAEDGEALKLRVEVTDDCHVQNDSGPDLWKGDSIQFAIAPADLRGYWRFGCALKKDGSPTTYLWDVPNGYDAVQALAVTRAEITRNEAAKMTVYEIAMPLRVLDIGTKEFRFNLLVNDNDGEMRESFIALAPGLGRNFDVKQYPLLKLKERK